MSHQQHWTTWAKACLLVALCLQSSFHTAVRSQLTSQTSLGYTGVTDINQLASETNSTSSSAVFMETSPLSLIESSSTSAEVDIILPTPTFLPQLNSLVLESGVSSSGITPTLSSAELAPLHSTASVSEDVNTTEGLTIAPSSSVAETLYRTTTDETMLLPSISTIATIVYSSVLDPLLISATSSMGPDPSSSTVLPVNPTTVSSHPSSTNVNSSTLNNFSSVATSSSSIPPSTSTPMQRNSTNAIATTFSPLETKPWSSAPSSTESTVTKNLTSSTKAPTNSSMKPGDEDRLRSPKDEGLGTPAIIAIGFGSAAVALIVIGIVIFVMKRKGYRHKKHDSSNFWDDNVTLSYINSHADFPKDFDAEMMSLDDDSFLNSLDSMTFANLWAADTAKHTNF